MPNLAWVKQQKMLDFANCPLKWVYSRLDISQNSHFKISNNLILVFGFINTHGYFEITLLLISILFQTKDNRLNLSDFRKCDGLYQWNQTCFTFLPIFFPNPNLKCLRLAIKIAGIWHQYLCRRNHIALRQFYFKDVSSLQNLTVLIGRKLLLLGIARYAGTGVLKPFVAPSHRMCSSYCTFVTC